MVYHPTARVLMVLELLQAHGQMSGCALAERLEVDTRTIRRYILKLQDIGIPIESEAGRYGGYRLRPGFKLPPMMFTDDEVLVLALGLLMARGSGLAGAGAAVESALAKIERVLPFALRGRLRALQESMLLDSASDGIPPVDGDIIARLSLASQQRQRVRLRYESAQGVTERAFDPYGVVCYQDYWYAVGYCHLRGDLRIFRLDRARSVAILEVTFTPLLAFDTLGYMLKSFEAIPDRWNIDVRLAMPLEEARRRIPRTLATLEQEGDHVRLRASIFDLDDMARQLIALACPMVIMQPVELRAVFLKIAEEIAQIAQISVDV
jgi:predicted DNA-binding transcriptional regulator YafY